MRTGYSLSAGALPTCFQFLSRLGIALVSVGCINLNPALLASDWPTYQKDSNRSAVAEQSLNLSSLKPAWVYQSPNPPQTAWAGPAKWDAYAGIRDLASMRNYDPVFHTIQVGNSVFFGSSADDSVYCLNQSSGEIIWTFTTDAPVRIAPAFHDGRVYFGSDDGYAYCVDAASGDLIWKYSPAPQSRKTLNNGRLISYYPCRTGVLVDDNGLAYFAMSLAPWKESYLCAVDAKTGLQNVPGAYTLSMESVTLEGALLASNDKIIAPQGRIAPLLFDKETGKSLGSLQGGGGCFVLLTPESEILHGPGNKTGWVQSSKESDQTKIATYQGGKAMIVRGGQGFLMKDEGIDAFDRVAKAQLWSEPMDAAFTMILAGNQLWIGERDQITCLHATTGRRLKQFPVTGRVYGLSAANGYLLASTDTGAIYAFTDNSDSSIDPSDDWTSAQALASALWENQPRGDAGLNGVEDSEPDTELPKLPVIAAIDEPGLISRWVFQSNNTAGRKIPNLASGMDATLIGKPIWERVLDWEALGFDGDENSVLVTMDLQAQDFPKETVTAEAWVRVDSALSWGGLVGAIQDNGSYEKGWLLGYLDNHFSFAVNGTSGPDKLTYLKSKVPFEPGSWAHVAGIYDGKSIRLYVNGTLVAESDEQQGPIDYPPTAFLEIGAYHDQDEHYRLKGAMREVRIYHRALSEEEIVNHASIYPFPVVEKEVFGELAAGPWIHWTSPDSAEIQWETSEPVPSEIILTAENGTARLLTRNEFEAETRHSIEVDGLGRNRIYDFQILTSIQDDQKILSERLELDTFFNFETRHLEEDPIPQAWQSSSDSVNWNARVQSLIGSQISTQGIALQWGLSGSPGRLAYELARESDYRVIVLDSNPEAVREAREALLQVGAYGSRVAVHLIERDTAPNWVGLFANLIYSGLDLESKPFPVDLPTAFAYLRPDGGRIVFNIQPAHQENWDKEWNAPWKLSNTQYPRPFAGEWKPAAFDPASGSGSRRFEFVRGPLHGAGVWSHQYGDATGAAFAGETLSGAKGAQDLEIQWMGRPGPRAQPDRNGRKPAPLSFGGRLFVQGLQRIIALDAYNGSVLWTWELPRLGRFNMPRDSGNWSANADSVFAAIDDEVWRFDAATGALVHRYKTPEGKRPDWDYDWGYLAAEEDQIIGSGIRNGSTFKEYWGGATAGWYDATSGPVTEKVSGESLFAMDLNTGAVRWERNRGWIMHSGVAFGEESIYIAEMRHPKVLELQTSRVGIPEMWEDLWLVALDRKTGEAQWEQKLEIPSGQVAFTVAYAEGKIIVNGSGEGSYHASAFDSVNGEKLWKQTVPWPQNHHGGHMARPAIVQGVVYIRPAALDLQTGKPLELTMPGGGCGTYAASSEALFFRSGNVTVWDREEGKLSSWERLRPDCWLSSIPAAGLLLSPEAGGGCSCGSWMETSVAFVPKNLLPRPTSR